jgi:hypothetical protein
MPRLFDRAGSPERLAIAPPAAWPSAFLENVGTPNSVNFAARSPSLHDPYRRFAAALTSGRHTAQGRRTARYTIVVEHSQLLLHTGCPALSQNLTTILAPCKAGVPLNPRHFNFIGREGDLLGEAPAVRCDLDASRFDRSPSFAVSAWLSEIGTLDVAAFRHRSICSSIRI